MSNPKHSRVVLSLAAVSIMAATLTQLSACAVAVIGGVAGAAGAGVLIATAGRRPHDVSRDDGRIEDQVSEAIDKEFGERDHHINITTYYRKVLLTGEVTSDDDRARAQTIAQGVQGVQDVINALAVMPPSSAFSRSQDAYITSKVRARLLNTNGVPSASVKVLTERGTVYLMGQLTQQEAQTTTDAIQQVSGVQSVARVIDYISNADVRDGSSSTITGGSGSGDSNNDNAASAPNPPNANTVNTNSPEAPATGAETRPVSQPSIQSDSQPMQVRTLPPSK